MHAFRMTLTTSIFLLSCISYSSYGDTCRDEIKRNNIIGNALFTLLFSSVNGQVDTWRDVGDSLLWGGSAGYLFFESRNRISKDQESKGIALAYLASSITENTTLGKHPLAHLRYGMGPLELQWSTPFSTDDQNRLNLGINIIDTISLASLMASKKAKDFSLRHGVMTATDNGIVDNDFSAYTVGRTVITKKSAETDSDLWHHELIHTTQYIQYSSFGSTKFDLLNFDRVINDKGQLRANSRLSIRVEWFNSLINQIDQHRDYNDRWVEIEAYRLAQNTSPDFGDVSTRCAPQVGFQIEF